MIKIDCYEVKTATLNAEYFGGGFFTSPVEFKTECFYTEEEAKKACERRRKRAIKETADFPWWIEKYNKDENFTVKKVTKKF